MTILLLIRHGNTDYVGSRLAGRTPGVLLNEAGCQQVKALAQTLAEVPIAAIFTSPLERTLQSAQPLADQHHLPIRVEPGLIELDYGTFTGQTFEALGSLAAWQLVHSSPAQVQFPGGETLAEAQMRASQTLLKVAAPFPSDAVVACFTHGDVIRLSLAFFLRIPLNDYQRLDIRTASISVVQLEAETVRVLQINHRTDEGAFIPASSTK